MYIKVLSKLYIFLLTLTLEAISEDELQQLIANNDQTIEENNAAIKKKKALIEKVLAQQETIAEQEIEINRLNIQKKEL